MIAADYDAKVKIGLLADATLGRIVGRARARKPRAEDDVLWAYLKDVAQICDESTDFRTVTAVVNVMTQSSYQDVVKIGRQFKDILIETL